MAKKVAYKRAKTKKNGKPARKIIALTSSADSHLTALCDDGTVWHKSLVGSQWDRDNAQELFGPDTATAPEQHRDAESA